MNKTLQNLSAAQTEQLRRLLNKNHALNNYQPGDTLVLNDEDDLDALATVVKAKAAIKDEALEARKAAAFFGGKALEGGSVKQKNWAEQIRASKIKSMTQEQAIEACKPSGLLSKTKFWIDQRFEKAEAIGQFIIEARDLRAAYAAAKSNGNADEVRELAGKYNALTTKWGF